MKQTTRVCIQIFISLDKNIQTALSLQRKEICPFRNDSARSRPYNLSMAGVVFIVCIPTVQHEVELKERVKKRSRTYSNKTLKTSTSLQNDVQLVEDDETTYLLKDCDSNVFNSLRSSSDASEEEKPSMEKVRCSNANGRDIFLN